MASRLCGCVCSNLLFLANYQQGSARISLRNLDQIPTRSVLPFEPIVKGSEPLIDVLTSVYIHVAISVFVRHHSLSSPPQLISKLLDPWEEQQEHSSSRRITTMVNEIAGEVRSGQRKVVVLGAPPGRALGYACMTISVPAAIVLLNSTNRANTPPRCERDIFFHTHYISVGAPQRAPRNTLGGRVISGNSGLVPLEVIKAKAALNVSDWDLDDVSACVCRLKIVDVRVHIIYTIARLVLLPGMRATRGYNRT